MNEHHLNRFKSKYAISATGCWEWTGRRNQHGYGIFVIGHATAYLAHRISFDHFKHPPGELRVLHRCDNPPCVNPEHLFLGTQEENIRDMVAKGRHRPPTPRFGETNPQAKLTEEQVNEIRRRYVPRKVTLKTLACEFGVSQSALSMILSGKRWAG